MNNKSLRQGSKFRDTISLAYPMVISGFAIGLINIFDTAFLGRVDELSLNISNIGGIIYFMLIMVSNGLGMGVQVILSRYAGEDNRSKIGEVFNNGLFLSLFLGLIITLLVYLIMPHVMPLILDRKEVSDGTLNYLSYRVWAIVLAYMSAVYRSFLNSVNRNKVLIWATFLMAIFNIILDYGLIFGNFGFSKMGVAGAALASGLAEVVGYLFVLFFTLFNLKQDFSNIHKWRVVNWKVIKEINKVSNPLILQFVVSNSIWLCFFILITNVGEREGAISNLVKGLFMFYMIPAWGFVQAVNAITSNLIGQGKSSEVAHYALRSAGHIIVLMSGFALLCLLFPVQILSLLTNNEALIADSVNVTRMMSGFIILGSSCSLFYNAYAGTGDTKTAMKIEVFSALLYLIYILYFIKYKWISVEVVWFSEYLYWIVIGVLSYLWLKKGKWKQVKI